MESKWIRFCIFLLAALVPGSCSIVLAPELYPEVADLIRDEGFQPSFLVDFWIWCSLSGFIFAAFFGYLTFQKIRNNVPEFYHGTMAIWLAVFAILGAASVWAFVATVSQIK